VAIAKKSTPKTTSPAKKALTGLNPLYRKYFANCGIAKKLKNY
jgi:hypothetical protein